jgi:CheY-like chemotaxis protein
MGKLKDEVLVHTTHELKTPLHSIIQMTQALLDGRMGPISEEQDRNLRFTISTAKRMSSMIFDIIDFENVKNGMLVLDLTHFDISSPLRMVVEVMQYLYREKGILLINHVPDYTHRVLGDIYRLRQVFYNLIGNALKYTEAGEVILTSSSKDGNVFIHVSDTGIGIEKDDFERIFEPHSRGVRQTGPQSGSAGLGLSIARQLIRQMGGDVWVSRSAPGQGAEFIISLPLTGIETEGAQAGNDTHTGLHPAMTSSGTPPTEERESGSRSRQDLQEKPEVTTNGDAEGMTILVVDGDVVFSRGIADLLIGKGYRVCVAHSGEQALRELKRDIHVGMVLLEVMMPGMSGYEACRRIRESRTLFELPVVLMLSAILPEDLETGMDAGANDFLVKPFEEQALLARVKTLYQLKTQFFS